MNFISRRTAIKGGAAVAVAALVPTVAAAGDARLLSEIAEFRKQWAEYIEVDEAAHKAWAKADAERSARPDHDHFSTLLKKHGADQSASMVNAARRSPGFKLRNSLRAFVMSCSEPLSAAALRATVVG